MFRRSKKQNEKAAAPVSHELYSKPVTGPGIPKWVEVAVVMVVGLGAMWFALWLLNR